MEPFGACSADSDGFACTGSGADCSSSVDPWAGSSWVPGTGSKTAAIDSSLESGSTTSGWVPGPVVSGGTDHVLIGGSGMELGMEACLA